MKILERYISRRIITIFAMTLIAMTGVVWATQALRQLDLVTSKGQTLLQFLEITMLALPFLVVIVTPFALMIALILVLNALSGDSELIVINATGGSRFLVLRPVMMMATLIGVFVATLSLYVSPMGLAELRNELTRVRADLIANIVKPGKFITVETGLTFHIRNRSGNGTLEGLLMHDLRDPETGFTYQSETGHIIEMAERTLLVMQNGTIQRKPQTKGDISIVRFQSYAFDLSSLIPEAAEPVYKPSERTTENLLAPSPDDLYAKSNPQKMKKELHERFSQPLYVLAVALIVFAFLGRVRTTRQGRGSAVLGAIVGCVGLRTAGFGLTALANDSAAFIPFMYAVPVLGGALAMWSILRNERLSTPKWLDHTIETLMRKFARIIERNDTHRKGVS